MAAPPGSAWSDRRWILVRAGGAGYGLPAAAVRHVVRGLALHPVPGARPGFLGLAQFAGEPLAVLDLCALVEGGAARSNQGVVLILGPGVDSRAASLGVAADAALRVVSLGAAEARGDSGPPRATVSVAGESFHLLDPATFATEEWRNAKERHDD